MFFRKVGAEAFTCVLLAQNLAADTFATHVFANGDELHLRGDYPLAGVVQLGNAFASDGAFGRQQAAEAQLIRDRRRPAALWYRPSCVR